jgi:hypothetical protein
MEKCIGGVIRYTRAICSIPISVIWRTAIECHYWG